MFEQCCNATEYIDFYLVHNTVTFAFGVDAEEILKKLLLYVPTVKR